MKYIMTVIMILVFAGCGGGGGNENIRENPINQSELEKQQQSELQPNPEQPSQPQSEPEQPSQPQSKTEPEQQSQPQSEREPQPEPEQQSQPERQTIPGLESLTDIQYANWISTWSGSFTQTGIINGVVVAKGTILGVMGNQYAGFGVDYSGGSVRYVLLSDRNDLTRRVPPAGFRATYQGAAVGMYPDGREEYGKVNMDIVSNGNLFGDNNGLNIHITDMRYTDDIQFLGVTIGPGNFSQDLTHIGRSYQRTELRGNFFGPNHDEVGGTFKADDLTGVFVVVK